MSRPSSPWFRESKGTWYTTLGSKKVSLGVKGRENEKEAIRAWHRLLGGMPLQSPQKPSESPIVPQAVPIVKADAVSVEAVIDAFLADAHNRVGKCCLRSYTIWGNRFKIDKGSMKADALTLASVQAWSRKPAWSSSTRHHALGVVATAFAWAKREGLIAVNPLVGMRKPPKTSRGAKALISADEHSQLVAHAEPLFGSYLELLWLTGARPSEIAGLQAEEIDYAQGLVIREQHKEAHLGKCRVILLSPEALAIIKGIGRESGLLFPDRDGNCMSERLIGERMRRLCKKAGVKSRTAYGYRHSFATDALSNGVPDAQVAALLGHSGTAMLHKHYSHLTARSQALREALGRVRSYYFDM